MLRTRKLKTSNLKLQQIELTLDRSNLRVPAVTEVTRDNY